MTATAFKWIRPVTFRLANAGTDAVAIVSDAHAFGKAGSPLGPGTLGESLFHRRALWAAAVPRPALPQRAYQWFGRAYAHRPGQCQMRSTVGCNCLIDLPAGSGTVLRGDSVNVWQL